VERARQRRGTSKKGVGKTETERIGTLLKPYSYETPELVDDPRFCSSDYPDGQSY